MSHSDHIWPALATLRRGEQPSPAEVDALVALARGECVAPPPPLLLEPDDVLSREWCAAYQTECLAPCPSLAKKERHALKVASMSVPHAERFYGAFHKWRTSGPTWAANVQPLPSAFLKHLSAIAAWAGPRLAVAARAEATRREVERAEHARDEQPAPVACTPPPGGFAELRKKLAAATSYGEPCSDAPRKDGER